MGSSHDKLNAYRRNGVKEYLVWQIYENKLDWFVLQQGRYVNLQADEEGIIRSQVFPGLWLSVSALCGGNRGELLTVLQRGLASKEHKDFVASLAG